MSQMMRQKYQQKSLVVEKHYKEAKEKCKLLKQDNDRLYDAMDIQVKKELKLEEKYAKTKSEL